MRRRDILKQFLWIFSALPTLGLGAEATRGTLGRAPSYWRRWLSDAAYAVLFEDDTERPGSSPLLKEQRPGTYLCAACLQPLFDAATKYDSGTGWPSFWRPLPQALGTRRDRHLWMERTEYHCRRCGGHQGHVFDDGPRPTGLRYCNNGLALRFVPKGESLPEMRS